MVFPFSHVKTQLFCSPPVKGEPPRPRLHGSQQRQSQLGRNVLQRVQLQHLALRWVHGPLRNGRGFLIKLGKDMGKTKKYGEFIVYSITYNIIYIYGVFLKWGYPNSWMVRMENIINTWRFTLVHNRSTCTRKLKIP